jgi:hypothetical protein
MQCWKCTCYPLWYDIYTGCLDEDYRWINLFNYIFELCSVKEEITMKKVIFGLWVVFFMKWLTNRRRLRVQIYLHL